MKAKPNHATDVTQIQEPNFKPTSVKRDLISAIDEENPDQFRTRAFLAERQKITAIEASDYLIDVFCPEGLGPHVPYFNYGRPSVRVYKKGTMAAHENEEKVQIHQKLHGDKTRFLGRD